MYDTFYDELKNICIKKDFLIEEYAKTGCKKEYKLYKIVLNPNSTNRRVCFSAGIHGQEISGPLGILTFLKKYNSQKSDPGIVLLPLANPHGFFKETRKNHQGVDLNKKFFEKPQPKQIQKIISTLDYEKIDFFITLHEDDEKDGFYIYKYSSINGPFNKIIDFLSTKGKICDEDNIYSNKSNHGIISNPIHDGSFSEWMYSRGVPLCICIEIPDKIKLKERVSIVSELIEYIIRLKI